MLPLACLGTHSCPPLLGEVGRAWVITSPSHPATVEKNPWSRAGFSGCTGLMKAETPSCKWRQFIPLTPPEEYHKALDSNNLLVLVIVDAQPHHPEPVYPSNIL